MPRSESRAARAPVGARVLRAVLSVVFGPESPSPSGCWDFRLGPGPGASWATLRGAAVAGRRPSDSDARSVPAGGARAEVGGSGGAGAAVVAESATEGPERSG